MTIAVNQGYAMARNPEAARAWNARRRDSGAPQTQTVAEYRATMAQMAAQFPGSVRFREH
jgi:hypothetical protein